MPCYDPRDDIDRKTHADAARKLPTVEAMLCAVLTVLQSLDGDDPHQWDIDWEEAGVDVDELAQWWKDHKAKDGK